MKSLTCADKIAPLITSFDVSSFLIAPIAF